MGDDCQGRAATPDEVENMRGIVRDGMTAGALGLSVSRNRGHYDPQGVHIPAIWAEEGEIFALADVLSELGVGTIQSGGGRDAELQNRLMTRLAEACGRQLVYNNLGQSVRQPEAWKKHMALVDEAAKAGIRANPLCTPNSNTTRFTMRNTQAFRGIPTWHPILLAADEEKLRAYSDPDVRRKLHQEVVEWTADLPGANIGRRWYDYIWVGETVLPKNKALEGKSIREIAEAQGKGIIDAFLDLVVEENLETVFLQGDSNVDKEAVTKILNYPNAIVGLSDGGAHVQFHGGYGYSTRLLGYWVREQHIMSLEQAVRRLTFESASVLGIFDRGLLRPGMAADVTIFDADTVSPMPEDVVHDFPAGGWRVRELANGIHYTIVNGQVLLEDGQHTGALPGKVLRNTLYHAQRE
jgi:N-acyl-D-amino-acid deacylase